VFWVSTFFAGLLDCFLITKFSPLLPIFIPGLTFNFTWRELLEITVALTSPFVLLLGIVTRSPLRSGRSSLSSSSITYSPFLGFDFNILPANAGVATKINAVINSLFIMSLP